MKNKISDNIIRQMGMIILIAFITVMIVYNLRYFIPGALGAITLYILFRNVYQQLTEKRKWKRSWASLFLMLVTLLAIAVPLWVLIEIMIPQIAELLQNKTVIIEKFNHVKTFLHSKPILKNINLSDQALMGYLQKATAYIPMLFNSVAEIFANIATAFFILYFMQVNTKIMEKRINLYIPFSDSSKQYLWDETNMMVKSNALGIPILALCQGIVACMGYWIFGVNNFILWGLLTGAASIVPAIGTMLIWIPICIVQFTSAGFGNAIGLTIYCLIGVGGIDNVLRFTILKRLGDVHPLITVFGVLLGLKLFGIMGIIFGPLLLSYFTLLTKIYRTEFGKKSKIDQPVQPNNDAQQMNAENNKEDNT